MCAIILILQLGLVLTSGFTLSSAYYTSSEPNLEIECLNDFLTEMVCRLNSDQVVTCSEYHLSLSRYDELFTCDLKQQHSSACECLVHMEYGFVRSEIYTVQLLREKNVVFIKDVNTTEGIKPKKPEGLSVKQTQNGNFLITWDTEYRIKEPVLSSDLISELLYYVEGHEEQRKTVTVRPKGWFQYELVGRNLESNSNYIVRARMKSPLNHRFSDYSDPVRFTTPPSPSLVLKIVIPVVCIILSISIFVIYCSCNKILTEWWHKIPTPKIATSFVKQVPNLLSFRSDFSPVHVDSSNLIQSREKIWPASSPVDGKSLDSLVKDGNLSEVSYSQTLIQSLEENSCERKTSGNESQSTSTQMLVSTQYYKNLQLANCNGQSKHANVSDISNMLYKVYESSAGHSISRGITFPALKKNLMATIQTDFKYDPWTGSSDSAHSTPPQFPPQNSEIIVVHGYQSINTIQDCASTNHALISSCDDVNRIAENICSKKAQNISSESPVILVENEYKDVQSLLRNSEKQQLCLIADPELKQLCGPDLHMAPHIEIDCSYHRV